MLEIPAGHSGRTGCGFCFVKASAAEGLGGRQSGFNFVRCHSPPTCLEQTQIAPSSVTLNKLTVLSEPHCTFGENIKKSVPTLEHCFEDDVDVQELSKCLCW